jgi:sulfoxide reductase catalytic subunit YedY
MLIRIGNDARSPGVSSSDITPEPLYLRRRELMKGGLAGAVALGMGLAACKAKAGAPPASDFGPLKPNPFPIDEKQNSLEEITHYNNYYEFGVGKEDPSKNAGRLKTRPWTVTFGGELKKPQTIDIDTLLKKFPLEERVYRLRCVEAWSMVIPWVGFPLGGLLKSLEPTSKAKYVAFETLKRPEEMPGQTADYLEWPYREGLRIDEAMHPLTILAVGLYGKTLPNQNGAPIRLVVPWKYGFKSIKSIVRITLQESQPPTSWNVSNPSEYGFYSNVNPEVDHPRWSQKKERRIGEFTRRKTLMFNGYGDQVANLYAGLDLQKNF